MSAYPSACLSAPTAATMPSRPAARAVRQRYQPVLPGSVAEDERVQQYLPLVKSMVGRIAINLPAHVDTEDLYSAGLVGLLNAMRNYKPECGCSFETYARLRIRGAILDELRRLDWTPRSVHSKARRVQAVMQELEQKASKPPTEVEMARALKITVSDYRRLLDEIRPATFICLDSVQGGEGEDGPTQYESIPDHSQESPMDGAARRELTRLIAERLEQLPDMQRKVLALYYFEGLRLREIAEAYGLTESRICQIHAQAILAIKAYLRKVEAWDAEFAV